ncbi:lysozyme [Aphelenchoides avenae]|nr:lysozyme [Aphelenchus avenae]
MKTYCSGRTTRYFIGRVYAAEDAVDDVGFKNIVDAMDVGLAGLARIQPCVGRASCPPAHVQAETLAAKMNDSFGDRLTGVFLEIIQPELWPRDNRTNGKFVADFLDTMRDNVPCHWFTGVYTNKSSFALIVGPYWMRRKYEDVRLWLPKHNDTPQFDPFGSWKQADFFQQDLELKHCGIVFDSDTGDLVRPGPQPSETAGWAGSGPGV